MKVKNLLEDIEYLRTFNPDIDELDIEVELSETYSGSLETDYTEGHLVTIRIDGTTKVCKNGELKNIREPYLKLMGYVSDHY